MPFYGDYVPVGSSSFDDLMNAFAQAYNIKRTRRSDESEAAKEEELNNRRNRFQEILDQANDPMFMPGAEMPFTPQAQQIGEYPGSPFAGGAEGMGVQMPQASATMPAGIPPHMLDIPLAPHERAQRAAMSDPMMASQVFGKDFMGQTFAPPAQFEPDFMGTPSTGIAKTTPGGGVELAMPPPEKAPKTPTKKGYQLKAGVDKDGNPVFVSFDPNTGDLVDPPEGFRPFTDDELLRLLLGGGGSSGGSTNDPFGIR